jgi:hypothetical protein
MNEKVCIFVNKWFGFIWMHMNIYVFFQKLNILYNILSIGFLVQFFFGSNLVHIFGVNQFNDRSGSHFWGRPVQ